MNSATETEAQTQNGTVKWFSAEKGYGFLIQDDDGKEVFCHYSAIQAEGYRSLEEGQQVRFSVAMGPKGKLEAQNVEVNG